RFSRDWSSDVCSSDLPFRHLAIKVPPCPPSSSSAVMPMGTTPPSRASAGSGADADGAGIPDGCRPPVNGQSPADSQSPVAGRPDAEAPACAGAPAEGHARPQHSATANMSATRLLAFVRPLPFMLSPSPGHFRLIHFAQRDGPSSKAFFPPDTHYTATVVPLLRWPGNKKAGASVPL